MEFVLVFQQPAGVLTDYADPEKGPGIARAWQGYIRQMIDAGVVRGAKNLDARHTTTVWVRDGQSRLQYGLPDATTPTGFVVIDVASMEDAVAWAELSPSSLTGRTDVVPVLPVNKN